MHVFLIGKITHPLMMIFLINQILSNKMGKEKIGLNILMNLKLFFIKKIVEGIKKTNPSIGLFINIKTDINNILLKFISLKLFFKIHDIK